ncbi:cell division protein FtsQ/DivIB [Aquimarina aquimarini]|uniref:cell division protein FtsQ/DivIB n=1 Tax=Aquimarina aquimarini TaxID=1191734 RepID=UPI000D54E7A3|nr:cell division protein FtsQ/DivIB [Aquimarina aquimarini]
MKNRILTYLKWSGLLILIVVLFAFASKRNEQRKISEVYIEFIEEQDPYINETAVNKLLIQNQERVTNVGKEILVLNTVEQELDAHRMIEHSDVYLTVNGELKAQIKQRTPIARVDAVTPFYVDATGNMMPLSDSHSAHVPIVHNVSEKEVEQVFPLLKKIRKDEFLKKHVVGIRLNQEGNYELELRVYSFTLVFGKIENLEKKIKNFKAFYQKARKDKSLDTYKKVSLQFSNQVVCTIK